MAQPVTVSDPTSWPEHIRARYAIGSRRRLLLPLAVLGGVAMLAFIGFFGVRVTQRAVTAAVAGYAVRADDHIDITVEVARRTAEPVTCALRARAEDGFDVGYAVVSLPAAQGRTSHEFAMRTAYRALVGELLGCAVGEEPPPGIAPAQFRAGVVPPDQPWHAEAAAS